MAIGKERLHLAHPESEERRAAARALKALGQEAEAAEGWRPRWAALSAGIPDDGGPVGGRCSSLRARHACDSDRLPGALHVVRADATLPGWQALDARVGQPGAAARAGRPGAVRRGPRRAGLDEGLLSLYLPRSRLYG
jgi:hypothetical protein